jgi:N-methylhydantoinase B
MFWSMVLAHQMDAGAGQGGMAPNAMTIWEDGVTFPGVKIFENDKENKPIMHMYLSNLRYPELQRGDIYAMMGTAAIGKRRLIKLCEEYGPDVVELYINSLLDYAEREASKEIAEWPDGTYYGEAYGDSDGQGNWDIKVRCKVTIRNDNVTIDWSESGLQVPGSINSSIAALKANTCTPIFCALRSGIPHNEGILRHIQIIAPKGLVVNGQWPASLSQATYNIGDYVIQAVFRALAHAIPEKVSAGWGCISSLGSSCFGIDRRGKESSRYRSTHYFGSPGGGAAKGTDGWPATHTACSLGGMKCEAVEIQETNYPIVFEKREIITDGGGYGQWNGGPALYMQLKSLKGHLIGSHAIGGGLENPCHGVAGGYAGNGGAQFLISHKNGKKTFLRGMGIASWDDKHSLVYIAPSGGGYGDPLDRDVEQVKDDLRDGFISAFVASEVYGVVINPSTYEINYKATERVRKKKKKQKVKKEVTVPDPGSANYIEKLYKPGDKVVYLEPPPRGKHKDWIKGKFQGFKTLIWR